MPKSDPLSAPRPIRQIDIFHLIKLFEFMKHLNIRATEIFCCLIDLLASNHIIDFEMTDSKKLVLEFFNDDIQTNRGIGKLYGLYQSNISGGRRSIAIKFIVVDGRKGRDKFSQVLIYPASYLQTEINIDEASIMIENGQVIDCKTGQQSHHCKTANKWMRTISRQSFFIEQFPDLIANRKKQNNFDIPQLLNMANTQKAHLLFALCPDISQGFLGYVMTVATGVINNTTGEFNKWENENIPDSAKILIAAEVKQEIEAKFNEMTKAPHVLAGDLFDDKLYPFLLHCLQQYISEGKNERFNRGVEFFFDI